MARSKKTVSLDSINQQIEEAQEAVIKAKKKYDEATEYLKLLLDKRKEIQTNNLMTAIMKSQHSYEEILNYINSEKTEEEL